MKKQADKIKRIGLIGNASKPGFRNVMQAAVTLVAHSGRQVITDVATAQAAGLKCRVMSNTAALSREVDLLLVFGGDGTMLQVAREIVGSQTPILGINIGALGFLTAVPSHELKRALRSIWKGEFRFERRALIAASGRFNGKPVRYDALNDFVVSRGLMPRLIELEVSVDRHLLTRYRCDGLIVSSPTGSTAYALAAGGAVVVPNAEVFELTPICPHTLTNRSLIVSLHSTIQIKVITQQPTVLSGDGQVVSEMREGDIITIKRSAHSVRLVHLAGSSFFETLRRKLHWRGASV